MKAAILPETLQHRVLAIADRFASKDAIEIDGTKITYANFVDLSCRIAATIQRVIPTPGCRVAMYGTKSPALYAGLLGTLLHGSAYVPLSLTFVPEYNRRLIQRSNAAAIIVDKDAEGSLPALLDGLDNPMAILLPTSTETQWTKRYPRHTFIGNAELLSAREFSQPSGKSSDLAYILFTSGSTGQPKGVPVTHSNIMPLIDSLLARHAITPEDRIAQVNDLTFDLSVAEMFTAWFSGASLCPLRRNVILNLTRFLRESRITILHIAPSMALAAHKMRPLTPRYIPDLRVCVFAGEPLPIKLVDAWTQAAPDSRVDNLYGPTEAAVYVTGFTWDEDTPQEYLQNGTVPIGYPLPGVEVRIVDQQLNEVKCGEQGELLLAGQQIASGYLADEQRTQVAFIHVPRFHETYYRTGDIVSRLSEDGPLVFHGRRDHQIKILGIRIELGFIEAALREATGAMQVAALGWPPVETSYGGVVAFVGKRDCDLRAVRERLAKILSPVLMPKHIWLMNDLPLTTSGKIDRNKLRSSLELSSGLPPG